MSAMLLDGVDVVDLTDELRLLIAGCGIVLESDDPSLASLGLDPVAAAATA